MIPRSASTPIVTATFQIPRKVSEPLGEDT
jgi:hypothetical protein